jgi:hypothetical protein
MLVDVIDHTTLLLELLMQRHFAGAGSFQFVAEILVGLLEALPMAEAVAEGIADDEAEGGGEQHPYG